MACEKFSANNGAAARQLIAMFGWRTLKMAEQYTRVRQINNGSPKPRCASSTCKNR